MCSIAELVHGFVDGLSKVIEEEGSLYGQISDEEWEAIRLTKKERQNEILEYVKVKIASGGHILINIYGNHYKTLHVYLHTRLR